MFDLIKKWFKKPQADNTATELPPVNLEPQIKVVQIEFPENDPRQGAFELEWNKEFVQWLRTSGYPGTTDEQVVDLWFQDLCKNVAMETWEQYDADPANRNYVRIEDIGNGRKSVS